MSTRTRFVAAVLLGLAGPACVSLKRTPDARFFVLRSLAEAKAGAELPAAGSVGILPVRIPGALARPELVIWTGANELRIDEYSRWAEPLDSGSARTLAENLAALLPRHRVLSSPWPASAVTSCRVSAELRVFGVRPDGEVRLEASFALLAPNEERVLARRSFAAGRVLRAGTGRGGPAAEVEAMSALLAELAKEVAASIEALP